MIITPRLRRLLPATALVGAAALCGAPAAAQNAAPPVQAQQMIGDTVYDASDAEIGRIVELVADPASGQVQGVVIHLVPAAGAGDKNVAVPMAELQRQPQTQHLTLGATKDDLQQAQNHPLADTGMSGSSGDQQAQQMVGDTVYNANDEEIGRIVELVADPASGQVQGVVVIHLVPAAGVGDKNVAVRRDALQQQAQSQHLMLDATKEELQHAQNYPLKSSGMTGSSGDAGNTSGSSGGSGSMGRSATPQK
jgi:sporulation protein YlmC with PRC-barrel domain